ncbi:MAG TPA: sucrase ferredoxin [Streptosporangiaceae bacterium]|nr:sucrase ferredoxin [Streptosporangiaceae bacterium]
MPFECEHGAACHDGTEPAAASAPEASRAWLLIEHPGPWPPEAVDAELPPPLRDLVTEAAARGVRVQLIRRPGRRAALGEERTVLTGWTAGDEPWLRRGVVGSSVELDVAALSAGRAVSFGSPAAEPVFLVCVHAKRNACCARFGVPLAQALAERYPGQVWETTHVGGHRYAANLVLLPHGLYYGPVDVPLAAAAIDAYQHGVTAPDRYRGRAGQPRAAQEAEHALLAEAEFLG